MQYNVKRIVYSGNLVTKYNTGKLESSYRAIDVSLGPNCAFDYITCIMVAKGHERNNATERCTGTCVPWSPECGRSYIYCHYYIYKFKYSTEYTVTIDYPFVTNPNFNHNLYGGRL